MIVRAIAALAAVLASAALLLEFKHHKDDEALRAAKERAFLARKYEDSTVTGPYQTIIGGCGNGSDRRFRRRAYAGGEPIPQRVYMVETPVKAFAVGVCRDQKDPLGYRAETGVVRE